jgi:hypothetical protein
VRVVVVASLARSLLKGERKIKVGNKVRVIALRRDSERRLWGRPLLR